MPASTTLSFAPIDGAAGAAYHAVTAIADLVAPVAGSAATVIAIVLFTALVRLAIAPLSWAQARGQRRQAALAPKLNALRQRHGDDPARLRTEVAALYRDAGTTPLAGCLPGLLQAPFFFVMYRLFTASTVGGEGNSLLDGRLLGVPLGQHAADGASGVFLALFAALAALAWLTSRRMRRTAAETAAASAPAAGNAPDPKAPDPSAAISRILPLLPYTVLIGAAVMPLAGGLYLLTTTAWSAVEQAVLRRRVPALDS
jgi:YidC/Oxa1 family membrane protein insertase